MRFGIARSLATRQRDKIVARVSNFTVGGQAKGFGLWCLFFERNHPMSTTSPTSLEVVFGTSLPTPSDSERCLPCGLYPRS
jgi:hypothetical protein